MKIMKLIIMKMKMKLVIKLKKLVKNIKLLIILCIYQKTIQQMMKMNINL